MFKFFAKRRLLLILAALSLVSLFYIVIFIKAPALKVVSTLPAAGQTLDLQNPVVLITFDRDLSSRRQNQVSLSVDPELPFRTLWDKPDQLSVIFSPPPAAGPDIKLTLSFAKKFLSDLIFKTAPSFSEEAHQQGLEDFQFGQDITALYSEMPFLTQLPVSTAKYVIVYDFDAQAIRVRLLQGTLTQLQPEIESALKNIGVDLKKVQVKYVQ